MYISRLGLQKLCRYRRTYSALDRFKINLNRLSYNVSRKHFDTLKVSFTVRVDASCSNPTRFKDHIGEISVSLKMAVTSPLRVTSKSISLEESTFDIEYVENTGVCRIRKASLSEQVQQAIREKWTAKPRVPDIFDKQGGAVPFDLFIETPKFVYVPPFSTQCDFEIEATTESGDDTYFSPCLIELRSPQVPLVSRSLDAIRTKRGCLLSVGCGYGKTVMSVYIACQLKVPTLVLVHKTFLMDQFVQTIRKFVPRARIGFIQGQVLDYREKDFVIGMIQTMSSDAFVVTPEIRRAFGFVVVDECHHIAARVFSRALLKLAYRFSLGLSATPNRKDGLGDVVKQFVGRQVISAKDDREKTIRLVTDTFSHPGGCCCKGYGKERTRFIKGKTVTVLTSMVTDIVRCPSRTKHVADIVVSDALRGKNVLVVSDRRDHLWELMNDIVQRGRDDLRVGLYVGGMSVKERDRVASECNVILGSYAMTREGLDIAKLDALVMATPTSDVIQVVGRVTRNPTGSSLIVDIFDDYSVFRNHRKKRLVQYKKLGVSMTDDEQDETGFPPSQCQEETYMFTEEDH